MYLFKKEQRVSTSSIKTQLFYDSNNFVEDRIAYHKEMIAHDKEKRKQKKIENYFYNEWDSGLFHAYILEKPLKVKYFLENTIKYNSGVYLIFIPNYLIDKYCDLLFTESEKKEILKVVFAENTSSAWVSTKILGEHLNLPYEILESENCVLASPLCITRYFNNNLSFLKRMDDLFYCEEDIDNIKKYLNLANKNYK